MKPAPIIIYVVLSLLFLSCGKNQRGATSPHHGAFFRSEWHSVYAKDSQSSAKSETGAADETEPGHVTGNGIRDALVREALQLYRSGKTAAHYGEGDVADIFKHAGCPDCWQTTDDAPSMVKKAIRLKAYRTRQKPEPGDLVLFHNQTDRNRNGKSDDWFTGVAVVVETGRHTHVAVTRTGGPSRKIFISPDGPMVRTYNNKTVNSFVRIPGPHDPVDAQYLSGQLYAGFIDSEVIVAGRNVR